MNFEKVQDWQKDELFAWFKRRDQKVWSCKYRERVSDRCPCLECIEYVK